ncbi:MAG: hypothetical protein HRU46_03945 [Verrucomicrobiales bacterium]|nr:hypothetical protein [Verrucomicrobiales bacterium]
MHAIDSHQRAKIAKLAYFFYQERVQKGLPGNELQDWQRAERTALEETEAQAPAADAAPVTEIKGIGPKVASELAAQGVTTVDQLAQWTLADFGEKLPRLTARARGGNWIEQAAKLARS